MYMTVNDQSTFSVVHRESADIYIHNVFQCLMKAMNIRLYYTWCEAGDSQVELVKCTLTTRVLVLVSRV